MRKTKNSALIAIVYLVVSVGLSREAAAQSGYVATCGSLDEVVQPIQMGGLPHLKLYIAPLGILPNHAVVDGIQADAHGILHGFNLKGYVTKVELVSSSSIERSPAIFNLTFDGSPFRTSTDHYSAVSIIQLRYLEALGGWGIDLLNVDGLPLAGTGTRECEVDLDALKQLAAVHHN